ncbi:MAG: ATPase V [Candidatus Nitrosotenuis sp.]
MASLSRLADKLKQQKTEASKMRRKNQRMLKEAKSLNRRSSSGLHTLERKIEDTREKMGDINVEFNQIVSRRESLERLIKAAHERLKIETDVKEQAEIELDNADSDDSRQIAQERIAQANEKIKELKFEIKQRESAAQKLVDVIDEQKKSKTKTSGQIQKQTHVKPTLVTLIKKSKTSSESLQKRVVTATKREESIAKNLEKVTKKLEEIKAKQLAKKRKEAAIKAAKKRAAKKRMLAIARKKAAKKRALTLRKKAAMKKKAAKSKKKAKKLTKKTKRSKKKSRR